MFVRRFSVEHMAKKTNLDEAVMQDKCVSKTMDLSQPFMVGNWLVEPAIERISKGELEEKVEPRVMDLLVCLASQPGEVISREDLESQVWSGMVVGYDALSSAMIKLRKAFHDDSRHPQVFQTVSKKGYRLIAEVRPAGSALEEKGQRTINYFNNRSWQLGIGVSLALIFVAIFYASTDHTAETSDVVEIPSIIVLPFVNRSDDQGQEYFSDGITEDIITDLSRISNLQVMASNTSFRYKGQVVKPEEINKELGVHFMLEGSVRKAGGKLRINSQLIDTRNGYHVWAERFDRDLDQVFAVQDELTRNIVNALAVKLTDQEETSLARVSTNNFQAYEHFLLGQKYARERTREGFNRARDEFREAIKLDPQYARSYGALAIVLSRMATNAFTDSPVEFEDRALEMARKAVELNNTLPHAYWALSFVHMYRNEFKEAEKYVTQALAIAPNYADGYGLLALIHNRLGNADKAIELIQKGMKLNPHYTWDYPYNLGRAYYYKGNYDKAIELLRTALARNEFTMQPRLYLTASLSAAGMMDDAEWEVEQILTINPRMTISHIRSTSAIVNPGLMEKYATHLRNAGLPD
ncbi:MAG: tetratricopeptide repeat protein [Gammaproteobacteria bacterium]|jgi:TolB-like protein/DNA-binding winged helix-turn-helix (wHTH) protein/Tfp pilus assembly protein PilF